MTLLARLVAFYVQPTDYPISDWASVVNAKWSEAQQVTPDILFCFCVVVLWYWDHGLIRTGVFSRGSVRRQGDGFRNIFLFLRGDQLNCLVN